MVRQTEEIHLVNEDNTDHVQESIDTFKIVVLDTMEDIKDAIEFLKKEIE